MMDSYILKFKFKSQGEHDNEINVTNTESALKIDQCYTQANAMQGDSVLEFCVWSLF